MECPSCGVVVAVDSVFPGGSVQCACGAAVVVPLAGGGATSPVPSPSPSTKGHGEAPCPRCRASLVVREEEGIVVTVCPESHGAFVAHRVLTELTQESPAAARALDGDAPARATEAAPATLLCPRCKDPMTPREFARGSGIVVDVCAAHGTWFDAGELRAAVRARATAVPEGEPTDLERRAAATLDVALALEQARDEETARRAVDLSQDLLDTLNFFVLGRTRAPRWGRYR